MCSVFSHDIREIFPKIRKETCSHRDSSPISRAKIIALIDLNFSKVSSSFSWNISQELLKNLSTAYNYFSRSFFNQPFHYSRKEFDIWSSITLFFGVFISVSNLRTIIRLGWVILKITVDTHFCQTKFAKPFLELDARPYNRLFCIFFLQN